MLEMRPDCERCGRDLPADRHGAFICSFECTFCDACTDKLDEKCPNCKQKNENKEFDIIVEADKISKVKILKDTRDYLANEGNYKILTN